MSQRKDDEQPVNGLCRANHKGLEAHIHFLLLEHDFNVPAVGVMGKDLLIRKGQVRTDEHMERMMIAKSVLGVGKQFPP